MKTKANKRIIGIMVFLIYTLIVSQLTHAMRKPVLITEYIEVEVPVLVYEEIMVEEIVNEWVRNIPLSEELQKYTWELCEEYDLAYDLVLGVIRQESSFNPNATFKNYDGSVNKGLMQLNDKWENWHCELLGISINEYNPFDEKQNIHIGILILDHYRHQWIDKGVTSQELLFRYTLNSYNMGIGGYRKTGLVSRSYDRKVLEYKIQLETEGGL